MATFHFVEDYEQHVASLLAKHPVDEAMQLAVGGRWEDGVRCVDQLIRLGMRDGMNVLDFGCGSGRVARAIAGRIQLNGFVGLDVVPQLVDYAARNCPPEYKFVVNRSLTLPVQSGAFDMIYAYSVFTHLLLTEIALYAKEMRRALRPGGVLVFSFLELERHWDVFEHSAVSHGIHQRPFPHLNTFLDRRQIVEIANRVGFDVARFIDTDDPTMGLGGQSVAVLRKAGA